MFSRLKSLKERWAERRAERRATRGERTLMQNEAKARRLQHERFDDRGGPSGPVGPGI